MQTHQTPEAIKKSSKTGTAIPIAMMDSVLLSVASALTMEGTTFLVVSVSGVVGAFEDDVEDISVVGVVNGFVVEVVVVVVVVVIPHVDLVATVLASKTSSVQRHLKHRKLGFKLEFQKSLNVYLKVVPSGFSVIFALTYLFHQLQLGPTSVRFLGKKSFF